MIRFLTRYRRYRRALERIAAVRYTDTAQDLATLAVEALR